MSLFDNMMNSTAGKSPKSSHSKKTSKMSRAENDDASRAAFKEEFSKDFSIESGRTRNGAYADDASEKDVSRDSLREDKATQKESFKEEFAEGLVSDVSHYGIQSYSKAGVTFEKLSENQARINYQGLLAKSGATEVEGVYGFGSNQNWENVSTLRFTKQENGQFSAIIPVEKGKNVNLAFKDAANNWDNNSGMNYTFVN